MAEWSGDFSWRKNRESDLIKQGLESVVVFAVDQRHIDRLIHKAFGRIESAESAAHDNHSRPFSFVRHAVRAHVFLIYPKANEDK